jgi:hypothetical protein
VRVADKESGHTLPLGRDVEQLNCSQINLVMCGVLGPFDKSDFQLLAVLFHQRWEVIFHYLVAMGSGIFPEKDQSNDLVAGQLDIVVRATAKAQGHKANQ